MNRANFGTSSSSPLSSELASLLSQDRFPDAGSTPSNWRESFPEIVGRSSKLLNVLEYVARVAKSDCAVTIYGESGTGKELIASALHRLSARSEKRFVALNCSAIPENLLETELFGHEKGAFTGAVSKRQGVFELARNGTLFLDEIGDMPQALQAKLLRVLQEKQFTPVGGKELINADVRIITATNVNLEQAVRDQKFRLDLFFRINVIPIELPSLRDRTEDIPELLNHFIEVHNRIHCPERPKHFTDATVRQLQDYRWPGNVRELQNLVERMVVTSPQQAIDFSMLPAEYRQSAPADVRLTGATHKAEPRFDTRPVVGLTSPAITYPTDFGLLPESGIDLTTYIEDLENNLILQALKRTNNNKNQAAKLLGINRTTLVERLKKRGIGPLRNIEPDGSEI
jgi:transcriptional regulator with PAS, ATPase and Fis domain